MDLQLVKRLCSEEKLRWTQHIFLRLVQRNISMADVQMAILNGELVEDYPDDLPYPSCLILGYRGPDRALHVVCAPDTAGEELWLITAYVPDTNKWLDDLKTRRGKQ